MVQWASGTAASPLVPSLQQGVTDPRWKGFCRWAMAGLDASFPKAEAA